LQVAIAWRVSLTFWALRLVLGTHVVLLSGRFDSSSQRLRVSFWLIKASRGPLTVGRRPRRF